MCGPGIPQNPPPEFRIKPGIKDCNVRRKETIGQYYLRINSHLIPQGVEFWEYDEKSQTAKKIN